MKKQILFTIFISWTLATFAQWRQTNCLFGQVRDFLASGSEFYITTTKGLFVSPDTGKTWKTVKTNIDADKIAIRGSTIITASGMTLWRSRDNGVNWENISDNFSPHTPNVIIY